MAASLRNRVGLIATFSKCLTHQHCSPASLSVPSRLFSSNTEAKSSEGDTAVKDGANDKQPNATEAQDEAFKQEKQKLMAQVTEYQDKYKRSLAEMENMRQRLQRQVDDAKVFGIQAFCKDLLDVADSLQRAVENTPAAEIQSGNNPALKTLFEGLQMTQGSMKKVFTKHGLVQIQPAEGEKFDPNLHEALFTQPAEGKAANTVSTVTKVGYQLRGRTLRPAIVGVYTS